MSAEQFQRRRHSLTLSMQWPVCITEHSDVDSFKLSRNEVAEMLLLALPCLSSVCPLVISVDGAQWSRQWSECLGRLKLPPPYPRQINTSASSNIPKTVELLFMKFRIREVYPISLRHTSLLNWTIITARLHDGLHSFLRADVIWRKHGESPRESTARHSARTTTWDTFWEIPTMT